MSCPYFTIFCYCRAATHNSPTPPSDPRFSFSPCSLPHNTRYLPPKSYIDLKTSQCPACIVCMIFLYCPVHRLLSVDSDVSIHAMRKSTMRDWRSGGIGVPFGTFHHFSRQLRQQQAHACCALNTGWPRMGVCFPSFGGFAGARRVRTKSSQCLLIVSRPFSAMYFRSSAESWNRLRNLDLASRANALSNAFTEIRLRATRKGSIA